MKKLLSVILVFCILFSSFSIFANAGSEKYISDIIFTEDKNDTSYTYLDFDINTGTMSDYSIYLGYKRTSIVSEAIRSIKFYIIGMDYDGWNNGFAFPPTIPEIIDSYGCQYNRVCWQDLNHGCWGDYIYAYYSKDYSAGAPITDILLDTKINDGYNAAYSFDGIIANLKSNALKIPTSLKGQRPYDFDSAPKVDISIYLQWISDGSISGKMFPAGYDFNEDSYNFKNYSDNISKKYFTTLFGNDKGKLLYKKKHNAGGLCFGFAYTTAAIYNGFPDISTIATRSGPVSVEICSCIRDIHHQWSDLINDGSALFAGDKILSIEDYIKYAYIYQFSKTVIDNSVWYNNDDTFLAGELLSLVKKCTDNNDLCITIGMTNKTDGGHRVLAVGYEGNDILVDDPNNTKDLERITVKSDGTWSFSGLDNWNSDTCYIRSNTDISAPYSLLCSGQTVTVKESLISENVTRTESYVEGMNILDNDCNLISINSNTFSSKENLTQVVGTESNGSENEEDINLYWTDENVDKVTLNDIKGEDIEISMAGNESIISTKASSVDDVSIDVESPSIIVSADIDSTYDIVFENYSENDNFEENEIALSVSGTASSDTVTATQTETGLVVTGISDGTVTLSKDDEVIETQEISNATSDIEITYDKTGENDDVSLDYEHNHTDSDADGKCDICGETLEAVKNCTHLCHKTGFLGFIWKIVNIFNKLFKINPVCSCGMKHY